MKACIYTRVSTAQQSGDNKGTSLGTQIEACRDKAESLGYQVIREAQEVYSGAYFYERPLLSEIRDDIRQKRFDALIVYAVDRLSRKLAHLALIVDDCERFGVELVFVTEELDRSPEGQLLTSVRAYVAEIEREKIRERSLRGKRAKAKSGTLSNKHRVYGYKYDPATDRREIVEHEAVIVRRAFNWVVSGNTMRSFATVLDNERVATPQNGKSWSQSTLSRILRNPIYCGKLYAFRYKKHNQYNPNGKLYGYNKLRKKEDWVKMPCDSEPIVSEELFDRVQEILRRNRKVRKQYDGKPLQEFLLRGMITCGFCGRTFTSNSDGRNYKAYVCDSRRSKVTKCGNKSISVNKIEPVVWNEAVKLVSDPSNLIEQIKLSAVEDAEKSASLAANLRSADRTYNRVKSELEKIVARASTVTDTVWNMMQEQITIKEKELKQVERLRNQAEAALKNSNYVPASLSDIERLCDDLRILLSNGDFDSKRSILKWLGTQIVFKPEKVSLNFKFYTPDISCDFVDERNGCQVNISYRFTI